ncbi:hypothetical protein ACFPL7_09710 [Dongia soli]|uniref:Flagellar protein FliL n=1 Tax=Dongia soli TaxID=600628 RepID=A0ABU5EAK5_9PROT|nr:hypothetical protein [Dongia soli]MDY0883223.1 hypothetical protein [Dongia soli]
MKKFLLILILLLLLGAGGGAGYWLYLHKSAPQTAEAEPPPPAPITSVTMDILPVSVVKNNRVARVFFFRFTLLFDAPERQARAQMLMPRLIDGFNTELHQLLARKLMEQTNYDPDLIIARLQEVADRVTGDGTVHQVTIANVDRKDFK